MGYAMFCSRKIMLVSQINDLQYRLTELTMKQQDLSQLSSAYTTHSAYTTQAQTYYNFTTREFDQAALDQAIANASPNADVNSLQDPNGTLKRISNAEKQIEMESKRLQTQLQAKQTELEAVEKGEEQGIKNATPKYA